MVHLCSVDVQDTVRDVDQQFGVPRVADVLADEVQHQQQPSSIPSTYEQRKTGLSSCTLASGRTSHGFYTDINSSSNRIS